MTQNNENGSRLDRLEAIMLDLASATVRHDNEFSRINSTLAQIAEQQQESATRHIQHEQWQANHEATMQKINATLANTAAQQDINAQQLAILTAGLLELRTMVANYIEGRSQT